MFFDLGGRFGLTNIAHGRVSVLSWKREDGHHCGPRHRVFGGAEGLTTGRMLPHHSHRAHHRREDVARHVAGGSVISAGLRAVVCAREVGIQPQSKCRPGCGSDIISSSPLGHTEK